MPKGEQWPLETKDKVCEMYVAGEPWNVITAATGVPMSTGLWWLHDRGIRVERRGRKRASTAVTVEQLLEQLRACERERGRLEARLAELEGEDVAEVTS
jgi:hypothetical protein